jgi:diacylglycerol kinase family enzyme
MRAVLVVNPAATTTTARSREVLANALRADLDLEVVATAHRGHATEVARDAVKDGTDLVIVLGGDGTIHEVVNGLLENGPNPDGPALAVVPGGSTNVFARALGLPNDPIEATGALLDALRASRSRSIGLSTADSRWFTFCAGMGLDAEVVGDVESRRTAGKRLTSPLFVRTALSRFYRETEREDPGLTLTIPGQDAVEGVFMLVVQNTAPWTYLGDRRIDPSPEASFDTGLDLFGLTRLRTVSTARHVGQLLRADGRLRGKDVVTRHDLPSLSVVASRPTALQLDGEAVGPRDQVVFESQPNAIRVVV